MADDLKSHELDPFQWRETIQAVLVNLLVPFKDTAHALEIKETEYEKDIRRR